MISRLAGPVFMLSRLSRRFSVPSSLKASAEEISRGARSLEGNRHRRCEAPIRSAIRGAADEAPRGIRRRKKTRLLFFRRVQARKRSFFGSRTASCSTLAARDSPRISTRNSSSHARSEST